MTPEQREEFENFLRQLELCHRKRHDKDVHIIALSNEQVILLYLGLTEIDKSGWAK